MEHNISFGKVKYSNNRKVHEIDIRIEVLDSGYLIIGGGLWNARHTDYIFCGQCLNELKEMVEKKKDIFDSIYDIWKKWHLKKWSVVPQDVKDKLEVICGGKLC